MSRYRDPQNDQEAYVHNKNKKQYDKFSDDFLVTEISYMRTVFIDIQALYHKSAMKISYECVNVLSGGDGNSMPRIIEETFEFGARKTVMYLK